MRHLLILIIVFSTIYISSCWQIYEDIGDKFAESVVESIVPVYAVEVFYLENGKWPGSQEELVGFCFQNKLDDFGNYWKSCEDFNLKELDDGSLEIAYKNTTYLSNGGSASYKGTIQIPKPSGDKKPVREEDIKADIEELKKLLMKNEKNLEHTASVRR